MVHASHVTINIAICLFYINRVNLMLAWSLGYIVPNGPVGQCTCGAVLLNRSNCSMLGS